MGGVDTELIDIQGMSDNNLQQFLRKNAVSLKVEEARKELQSL